MGGMVEVYQSEFDSGKVDAVAEGVGTWKRKPVVVRARLMKQPFIVHTPGGAVHGDAGDWLIEDVEGGLYPCKASVFDATYEYDGPAE